MKFQGLSLADGFQETKHSDKCISGNFVTGIRFQAALFLLWSLFDVTVYFPNGRVVEKCMQFYLWLNL